MSKSTNSNSSCQDVLCDVSQYNKKRPWKIKKKQSLEIAESFKRLNFIKQYENITSCGKWLVFFVCAIDGFKKLIRASFCRLRFCPMCAWRKSLVWAYQVKTVCHTSIERQPLRFLHLGVSVKNPDADHLRVTVKEMLKGWKRFTERQEFKHAVEGYFRSLETTYNKEKDNYHPHIHVILAVKPSYFTGRCYLKFERWRELWKKSMRLDYDPNVDIRVIKNKSNNIDPLEMAVEDLEKERIEDAVRETTKYLTKFGDFIMDNKDKQDEVLLTLKNSLSSAKLYQYGGILKTIAKELKFKNVEDKNADLINTSGEVVDSKKCKCEVCQGEMSEVLYSWIDGDYRKKEITEKFEKLDGVPSLSKKCQHPLREWEEKKGVKK